MAESRIKEWRLKNPEKSKQACKNWRANNKEAYNKYNREYRLRRKDWYLRVSRAANKRKKRKLKEEVIRAYGGKCSCVGCTEFRYEFMTIDHLVKGDTQKDRKKYNTSHGVYAYLRREGFPKDRYRLLCFNCNCSYGVFGYCPHNSAGS